MELFDLNCFNNCFAGPTINESHEPPLVISKQKIFTLGQCPKSPFLSPKCSECDDLFVLEVTTIESKERIKLFA